MVNLEKKNASVDEKEELLKWLKTNINNLKKEITGRHEWKDTEMPIIELPGQKNAQEAVKLFTAIYKPLYLNEVLEEFLWQLTASDAKLIKEFRDKTTNRAFETLQKNPEFFCETKDDNLWYVNEERFSEYYKAILTQMSVENNEIRKIFKKFDW